jgi:hypothetical protein
VHNTSEIRHMFRIFFRNHLKVRIPALLRVLSSVRNCQLRIRCILLYNASHVGSLEHAAETFHANIEDIRYSDPT